MKTNVMSVRKRGREYFYFRRKGKPLLPLPDPRTHPEAFEKEYTKARALMVRHEIPADLDRLLKVALRRAVYRDTRKNRRSDITIEYLRELFIAQRGRCALTGFPITAEHRFQSVRNPLAPSIDRMDGDLGYRRGNVQIVTTIANVAKSDFGEDAFYEMCAAAVHHQRYGKENKV